MLKKTKKNIILLSGMIGLSVPIILSALSSNYLLNTSNSTSISSSDQQATAKALPATLNTATKNLDSLEKISTQIGPIVVTGNYVYSLDWYDNLNWSIDLSKYGSSTTVSDWEFLQNLNYIYLITDTSYLLKVDALTGEILAGIDQATSGIQAGSNKIGFVEFNQQLYVWNSYTKNGQVSCVDTNTLKVLTANVGYQGTNESILSIQKLITGYSLKVSTTDAITSSTSLITNVKISFVQDNLTPFSVASPGVVASVSLTLGTPIAYNNLPIYNFYRASSSSYILIIANKIYTVILNSQDMTKSTITEFVTTGTITNNINSAFIAASDSVYLKAVNDTKIYVLRSTATSLVSYIDLATATSNSTLIAAATATNDIQIYGVMPSTSSIYIENQIFVGDSNSTLSTGISNATALGDFLNIVTRPSLEIKVASATFYQSIPSQINSTYFQANNADTLVASNLSITPVDYTGALTVKAKLTKKAWYSTSQTEKTITNITKDYTLSTAPSKFTYVSNTVLATVDGGFFSNLIPSQLTANDFTIRADKILLPSISTSYLNNLQRTFIVKSINDSLGTITVSATVSYTNQYSNYVSFTLADNTYTVKKQTTSDYRFSFVNDNDPSLNSLKVFLPSLINPNNITNSATLNKFISEEINYPPSRRVIELIPDDTNGTLVVNVVYNGLDPSITSVFTQTFTNFMTLSGATVKFSGTNNVDLGVLKDSNFPDNAKLITSIPDYVTYNTLISRDVLVTQLTKAMDYSRILAMGFNPVISILPLTGNEVEFGGLTVEIDFSSSNNGVINFPSIYANSMGLQNYKISQEYFGFLPIKALYSIDLQSYNSTVVQDIVKTYPVGSIIPTSVILSAINFTGYTASELGLISYTWNNETLTFRVAAQSKTYSSINTVQDFSINWATYFQSNRLNNLIIGLCVAFAGLILIIIAIVIYIWKRNKIRRYLK